MLDKLVIFLEYLSKILIVVVAILLLYGLCNRLNEIVEVDKKLDKIQMEIDELWKNVDALSEDYSTLHQKVYKEVE